LSFPSDLPIEIDEEILGDVVICNEIVAKEAKMQQKTFNNHLIHMAIHGTLHLLGYDHVEESEAQKMEALEVEILEKFNINNPYI
jgi:probable rRNA maturation factor